MTIARLKKVTLCGAVADKPAILRGLQSLGILHLESLTAARPEQRPQQLGASTRQALQFLRRAPHIHTQSHATALFDPQAVEQRALAIQQQVSGLKERRDFLRRRISDVAVWGNFHFPPPEQMAGLNFWFYVVPHYRMPRMQAIPYPWQEVSSDSRNSYVVVVAPVEPEGIPAERTHTGSKPLTELEQELEEVEGRIDDLTAERISLTRWCDLLLRNSAAMSDGRSLENAARLTQDDDCLFVLQGWISDDRLEELDRLTGTQALAYVAEEPGPDEEPPSLLRNPALAAGGQQLVTFYMTPSYRSLDPSGAVTLAFALFFAFILSDAGYALILGLFSLLSWRALGRSDMQRQLRGLLALVVTLSLAWGVAAGSYFGTAPPASTWLAQLQVLDYADTRNMMILSILVGVAHIVLAQLMLANHLRDSRALACIGWIVLALTATAFGLRRALASTPEPSDPTLWAPAGFAIGMLLVLLFSSAAVRWPRRLLDGLLALTRITGLFGDAMSYMRLFALGLAGASLASVFNTLALKLQQDNPGLGLLLALLLLLFGHSLNLVLGIVGGVVHGLRLNFIEFFGWSLSGEGRPFIAFSQQEKSKWNH